MSPGYQELTEESLILWGRDVSIRNRKKILKLTRQIETQYLSSVGRQQSSQSSDQSRQPLGSQLNPSTSSDQESETSDSDDSFSSDDFDDNVETESKSALHSQPHTGNGISSPDNVGEGLYLTSISEAGNRSFPNSSKPQVPNKPMSYPRKSCVSPEKRPQMPLPAAAGNQAPLLPPRPGTKLSSPPEICKRGLVPVPNSGESQRCIPTPPNTAKPVGNALLKHGLKDWPPKKPSEISASQNSQPECISEGRLSHRFAPSPPVEDTDNEYEVVGSPSGTFIETECHSASSCGFPSSQEPPPLPKRNQDGRDGNWTGPGLQQLSSTASNTPGRLHPPSSLHSTRNLLPGNNSPVRKQPSQLKPPNLAQGPLTLPSAIKSSPQFGQQLGSSAPLEKAPKPPTSLSDLSDAKRPPFLPPCVERINIGDGVSVELSPLYRTLIDRPYFHVISRSKSKKLLEKAGDGVFLIRPSTRSSDPLTLCLQYGGRTYNINIRRRNDAHYALGTEKVNEMTFKSVDELVSTYSKEPIKLQSGNRVRLSSSPAKEDHIYVRLPVPVQKKY
ncbi:WAS/WASL-interacting protein family member 1-like isoform X3 [Macrobrachium nipponense]|uniref:WAS/WASL-interacting protein family member 1-like isoform X3 n=1 Tax=Macrobrachium nipponense TaxID=159736 RepID=UPI0030C7D25D